MLVLVAGLKKIFKKKYINGPAGYLRILRKRKHAGVFL